jgi:Cu/Ag efflux protein CusF
MTKTIHMIATALLILGPAMLTAAENHPALAQAAGMIDGQVTKVDQGAKKITIKHGPIKKFDMDDGMTMVFAVQDQTMLQTVKAGDKIKFNAERIRGQFVVTRIEKAL